MSKVAIVGCRNYSNYDEFKNYIKDWEKSNGPISVIISAGASGADNLAEKYAKEYKIEIIIHKADWAEQGRAAGPIRNTKIVNDCDTLIAFPSSSSKGTWDSVKKAKYAKKNVTIYKI